MPKNVHCGMAHTRLEYLTILSRVQQQGWNYLSGLSRRSALIEVQRYERLTTASHLAQHSLSADGRPHGQPPLSDRVMKNSGQAMPSASTRVPAMFVGAAKKEESSVKAVRRTLPRGRGSAVLSLPG